MPVTLLTWNIKKDCTALALLERYVRSLRLAREDYVVALQELPPDEPWQSVKRQVGGYAIGTKSLALLCSQPLQNRVLENRFVMGVASFGGRKISVVSYHGHGNQNDTAKDVVRGGYASEYRWVFGKLSGSKEIVILGDFNAQPNSLEICHRACFSLRRQDESPSPRILKSHRDPTRKDIRSVAPRPDSPTHVYGVGTDSGQQDVVYDYFAASVRVSERVSDVEVLDSMANEPLKEKGSLKYSDHLPVRAIWRC